MTITQIKKANKAAGFYFFEPDTMRFLGSRVSGDVFEGPGGVFFVTSELPPYCPRAYTVRKFDPATGDIDTFGQLLGFPTLASAKVAARNAAQGVQP